MSKFCFNTAAANFVCTANTDWVFMKCSWSKNNIFGPFYWPLNVKKETNYANKPSTFTLHFVFQLNYVLYVHSVCRFVFCSRKGSVCPPPKDVKDPNRNLWKTQNYKQISISICIFVLIIPSNTHPHIYEMLSVWKRLQENRSPCRCWRCQISLNMLPQQDQIFSNFLPGVAARPGPLLQPFCKTTDLHLWCVRARTHTLQARTNTHYSSGAEQFNPL